MNELYKKPQPKHDWAKVEWPSVDHNDNNGQLNWTDQMFGVIDAVHQNKSEEVLPHIPEKLLRAMIFNYAHEIDGDWVVGHGDAFIKEFGRRGIPKAELISILPDYIQEEFIEKYEN